MNWTERRERLRAIVEGKRCVFPASVYDGISARIAGELGFEAMMFAGSVGSFSVLAAPDLCVLTLTEFAQQAYRINRAGSLPLCVDADHGYGNALSVKRTVEELETAGVSALTIEDTLLPIPFGGDDAQLISIEEGVSKMRAALAEVERLWGAKLGTADGDRLDVLATLIEAYESTHYPMDPPDPVEAIKFRMEQQGLSRKDLESLIGTRTRVAEILNRRRNLSIGMIRRLHKALGIPAEVLIRPSRKAKAA